MFCKKNYNVFPIWFSFIVIIILNQLNIKKFKSTETILEEKNTKKGEKIMLETL